MVGDMKLLTDVKYWYYSPADHRQCAHLLVAVIEPVGTFVTHGHCDTGFVITFPAANCHHCLACRNLTAWRHEKIHVENCPELLRERKQPGIEPASLDIILWF